MHAQKGKRLGRPRVFVSESKIATLRAGGTSWSAIAKELGVGVSTVYRAAQSGEIEGRQQNSSN
jgi:DNA invertase Pin-like site-specific DNA recombinase